MTDAMLRLAMVFHHDAYADSSGTVWTGPKGPDNEIFDPINNAEQFCDVLAWLACQTDVHITDECAATQRGIYRYAAGTAKGLLEAVVQAAMRMANENQP